MADALRGAMAVYEDGSWVAAQQSVVAMFGGGSDEFLDRWPKAGAVRGVHAHRRDHVGLRVAGGRYWPTPAASLPNDGERPAQWLARWIRNVTKDTGATNSGVPLAVASRAPVVLTVTNRGTVERARGLLDRHAEEGVPELDSDDVLNPGFAESLMGFPPGWTDADA